jgi:2-polyprenyl-3-methyl-5-hydroxy-6-metoxy-1,4-benzoquinol methylase
VRAQDWDRKWRDEQPRPRTDANRFLVAEVPGMAAGRALDLACGAGRNAVWLAEQGWEVTGVDFSEVALEHARRLARSRRVEIEWVLADVLDWQPPSGAFDLVTVLYLQLPAGERSKVLARAASALAPGGTLLVIAHDLTNLTEGWGGPKSADVLYTADEVAADLSGLVVEKAERVTRVVEDEEGEHTAIDVLVKATRPRA